MRALRFTLLLVLALAGQACTSNGPSQPVSTLLADPVEVVAAGSVRPVDGITSSGQPDEAAFNVYAASGYAAVIDIRGERESRGLDEQAVVEGLGMQYVPFPIEGRGAVNFENAVALDKLLESYDAPVLIHCGSGNRVGALLALGLIKKGVDQEAALEYGRNAGLTRLEDRVLELIEEK